MDLKGAPPGVANPLLPHEPLHQARFLRPFKTPFQENVPSSHIDRKEPYCLEPKSVIMRIVQNIFDNSSGFTRPSTITTAWGSRGIWPQGRNMKTPHQPRNDKISWFDKRRGDKGSGGG